MLYNCHNTPIFSRFYKLAQPNTIIGIGRSLSSRAAEDSGYVPGGVRCPCSR